MGYLKTGNNSYEQGHPNQGGNDAFCVIGNVGGKLKDAATRCILRPYRRRVKMHLQPGAR